MQAMAAGETALQLLPRNRPDYLHKLTQRYTAQAATYRGFDVSVCVAQFKEGAGVYQYSFHYEPSDTV